MSTLALSASWKPRNRSSLNAAGRLGSQMLWFVVEKVCWVSLWLKSSLISWATVVCSVSPLDFSSETAVMLRLKSVSCLGGTVTTNVIRLVRGIRIADGCNGDAVGDPGPADAVDELGAVQIGLGCGDVDNILVYRGA